jgi:glycolate oxidase FAD binding subunit
VRWLWAPADQAVPLRALAQQHGGHATLFRAARPADKTVGVFTPLDPVQLRIQQALKREFDPAGLFNPGRLYPEL